MKIFFFKNRPESVIAFFLLLFFLGSIAFFKIPVTLLPDINYPLLTVETEYENASAEQVEEKITEILEKSISVLPGLKYHKSVSYPGKSIIYAVFNESTEDNLNQYYIRMREKIETARAQLPFEAKYPVVSLYDPENMPSLTFAFHEDLTSYESFNERINHVKNIIESIDLVAKVNINGMVTRKMFISPDFTKMSLTGIKITDVIEKIRDNNFDFPGGVLSTSEKEININIKGRISAQHELENLLIKYSPETQTRIYLKDIATVNVKNTETNYAYVDGKKTALFEVYGNHGAGLVKLSQAVNNRLSQSDFSYTVISDFSEYITISYRELILTMITAIIITLIITALFFGNLKLALIVCTVIPFSIVINMIMMYFLKISLNTLSMAGLVISVGLIVDNALVVCDKLYYNKNLKIRKYIFKTLSQTSFALIASTLTTIIAFLPVIFLDGITGEFFRQTAYAISFTLIISLFTSFFLIPALFSITFKEKVKSHSMIDFIIRKTKSAVCYSGIKFLKHYYIACFAVILVFTLSVIFLYTFEREFMPETIENTFAADIDSGNASDDDIASMAANISSYINSELKNKIVTHSISVDLEKKKIRLNIRADSENKNSVYEKLRQYFEINDTGADLISSPSWNIPESFRMYVRLNIIENELDKLYSVSENLSEKQDFPFFTDRFESRDSINIIPEIQKTELLDLESEEIVNTIKAGFSSVKVTEVIIDDESLDVFMENADYYSNPESISVVSKSGQTVFLKDVANINNSTEYSPIYRYEGKRALQYRFSIFNRIDETVEKIKSSVIPYNVDYSFTGLSETKDSMISSMFFSLMVAVVLIYLILVIQFESFTMPFIIIILIPVSYLGAFFGWKYFNISLNMMSLLGLIILTGITVNNSIIVLTEIIKRKSVKKAILSRTKAVIITTLTTITGSIPMIFGNTSELRTPMAITVIGGMALSWIFSLVLLPGLYGFLKKYEKTV